MLTNFVSVVSHLCNNTLIFIRRQTLMFPQIFALSLLLQPVLEPSPFLSVFFLFKEHFKAVLIDSPQSTPDTSPARICLHFDWFSVSIRELQKQQLFLPEIHKRRLELKAQKEYWRPFVQRNKEKIDIVEQLLREGELIPCQAGSGTAYLLFDEKRVPRFLIKPVDEDIFCLNNHHLLASPYNDSKHRARKSIPLYRCAQIGAFCWEIASICGLEKATAPCWMGILQDDRFYDLTQDLSAEEREYWIESGGIPDREKLCSIQEFIPGMRDFTEHLQMLYQEGFSDEEICSYFDQRAFEETCLFVWLIYDNDGHGENFIVKNMDRHNVMKIDNALSLPEQHTQYKNILAWTPNASLPISNELKEKIAAIRWDLIEEKIDLYELSESKAAFKERLSILQSLASQEGMTIGEIDLRLTLLSQENGNALALKEMSKEEVFNLFADRF